MCEHMDFEALLCCEILSANRTHVSDVNAKEFRIQIVVLMRK